MQFSLYLELFVVVFFFKYYPGGVKEKGHDRLQFNVVSIEKKETSLRQAFHICIS